MKTKSLGFIGGGRITRILLQAFSNKKAIFDSISVFEINADIATNLKQKFPYIQILNTAEEVAKNDIVFLAVHPPVIKVVLNQIRLVISPDSIIISLAPKITINNISEILENVKHIVRLIPAATSIINHGYNPVSFAEGISEIQKKYILEMLNLMGQTFETSENKLEAYALISAMLPTYFWFQFDEIENIGEKYGLSKQESKTAIFETLSASLNTMYNTNYTFDEIDDFVPVKPLKNHETQIRNIFRDALNESWLKIKSE